MHIPLRVWVGILAFGLGTYLTVPGIALSNALMWIPGCILLGFGATWLALIHKGY